MTRVVLITGATGNIGMKLRTHFSGLGWTLRLLDVNVGLSAAVRRLLQGLMAKHTLRTFSNLFPSKIIPWEFVNLIESDPARRVKLRISYERLGNLHPADIADISIRVAGPGRRARREEAGAA